MRPIWRLGGTSKTDNARRPVRKPAARLSVEALEERTLLSAYTINHTPYIQLGDAPLTGLPSSTKDQAQILWQTFPAPTADNDTFQVQYRVAGVATWTNSSAIKTIDTGVGGRINHFVTLVGLNYDTDYNYVVRHLRNGTALKDYTSTFHTRLPAGSTKPFSFAAYGDSALGSIPSGFIKVQTSINKTNAAFSLLLGDNAYESGTHAEFDSRFDPSKNAAATTYNASHVDYYAIGNHEVETAGGKPSFDNYAVPVPVKGVTSPVAGPVGETPELNYSFDYGRVHFAALDSNGWFSSTRLKNQLDWLAADMQLSTAAWKVVFAHHALGTVPGSVKQAVVTTLQHGGVDLYLSGHDHSYHRGYKSFDGSSVSGDNYEKGVGLLEITAGEGGETASSIGFLKVDVTPTVLNMTYIDANKGTVADAFSIGGTVANRAPTNIVLTPASVPENSPNGTVVGQLTAADPDRADTHTYSLVSSANGRFAISGDKLVVANGGMLNAEANCTQAVFVKATDRAGLSLQKTLSIAVAPVNEFAPNGIGLSAGTVVETARNGTEVGVLSTTDTDACGVQSFTYELLDDSGGRFAISGNRLIVADGSLFDHVTGETHTITVQTADSGGLTFEQDFMINVEPTPTNQAPEVDAGVDQTVAGSGSAKLVGKVTDDGLPNPPAILTTTWSQVSGPGTATFVKASAAQTTATFSAAGTYVLRLEADDGSVAGNDDVTITVTAAPPGGANQAPQVNAGADQTVPWSKSASLAGKVKDDGLPKSPGKVTTLWTKVDGPGTVTFAKAASAQTTATFGAHGTYVLRLEASDGVLTVSDDVTIIVTPPPPNQAPKVNAGADQTLPAGKSAKLTGKAKDDGLPKPPAKVTTTWSQVSGPGTVSFKKAASLSTTASFSAPGTYVLRLEASDGSLKSTDDVTIIVGAPLSPIAAMLAVRPAPSSSAVDTLLASRDLMELLFDL